MLENNCQPLLELKKTDLTEREDRNTLDIPFK